MKFSQHSSLALFSAHRPPLQPWGPPGRGLVPRPAFLSFSPSPGFRQKRFTLSLALSQPNKQMLLLEIHPHDEAELHVRNKYVFSGTYF